MAICQACKNLPQSRNCSMLPEHPKGIARAGFFVPALSDTPESRVEQRSKDRVAQQLVQLDQDKKWPGTKRKLQGAPRAA